MNSKNSIDTFNSFLKEQEKLDEMRKATENFGRDQFVRKLVNQKERIEYLERSIARKEETIIEYQVEESPILDKLTEYFQGLINDGKCYFDIVGIKDILNELNKIQKELNEKINER